MYNKTNLTPSGIPPFNPPCRCQARITLDTQAAARLWVNLRKGGERMSEIIKKALTDKSARNSDSLEKTAAESSAVNSYWA
jgi:hypothetical protein